MNKTGLNEELLARVLVIKHFDLLNGIVRPVRLAPSIQRTVKYEDNKIIKTEIK